MKPVARVFLTMMWLGVLLIGGAVALRVAASRVGQHKASTYGDAYWQFQQSWGGEVAIAPPEFHLRRTWTERVYSSVTKGYTNKELSEALPLVPLDIVIDGTLDYGEQKRGLLVFNAFEAEITERYQIINTTDEIGDLTLLLARPENAPYMYDYAVRLPDADQSLRPTIDQPLTLTGGVKPGQRIEVVVGYRTKGMDTLRYTLSTYQDAVIDSLRATLALNTQAFEVLRLGMPHQITEMGEGAEIVFEMQDFATTQDLGIAFDSKAAFLDQIQSLMQYSPIALVLWIISLFVFKQIRDIRFNGLHYLFLGSINVFYYLFVAYLIRFFGIWLTFGLATALTAIMFLVYAPNVLGWRFSLRIAGPYLGILTVGFSLVFMMPIFRGLMFVSLCFLIFMSIMISVSKSDISRWPILRSDEA